MIGFGLDYRLVDGGGFFFYKNDRLTTHSSYLTEFYDQAFHHNSLTDLSAFQGLIRVE